MSDNVVYIRNAYPSGFMPTLTDQLIEDFRTFAELPEDDFVRFTNAISQAEPFLDQRRLNDVATKVVQDTGKAVVVSRVVNLLYRMEANGGKANEFIRKLAFVEPVEESESKAIAEDKVQVLFSRLQKLRTSWRSLERQKKAESLGKATGQRLQAIQLICDLRPVFDTARQRIEGWLPLTTMHIATEGADGLPNGLDALLSASDVDNLVELAVAAQRKLKLLRESVEQLKSQIPSTEITVNEE